VAGDFSLLETMRLEDGRIPRLERHLSRMAASALLFGYPWDQAAVRGVVAAAQQDHPHDCWRLRLLVDSAGEPIAECSPHRHDTNRVWRVAFAREPIDERDPFLFNKTTRRAVYEHARTSHPSVDDVILWNRRGEVTESTIANVVAEIDGERYTPPIECGLLAGVFRAEMLDRGTIHESVITRDEFAAAPRVWLINSLREWIEARLVTV
jgi:para-aminobenzoate synthetase/4-amino-4-deoxychorismate lyase